MKVREIMTPGVQCIRPDATVRGAAELMLRLDIGVLPVSENDAILGMLTDRDIVIRFVVKGDAPASTEVHDVMTPGVVFVYDDDALDPAVDTLTLSQIRRAPVVTRDRRLVGILSLGDIAVEGNAALAGEALKQVSQPTEFVR